MLSKEENASRHSERDIKQVILIRKDLGMGVGKIAAQASHASLGSYMETAEKFPKIASKWIEEGQTKIVLKLKDAAQSSEIKKRLKEAKIPFKAIKDAGQTQVPPGTETAVGIGPYYKDEIDKITGDLPLL
ncbi:MAG: peptidyl-tRNA hydrolase Pth2 [Candidatus Parvarchaeota archaeon]|nr:peptidyl-tRNA hydrolase Pth2 [Candidatus Parvarchaeota archaeon]